jgi:hypothetical protein
MIPRDPPGLLESDIKWIAQQLPDGRGFLRVARYEPEGTAERVVYEVVTENGDLLRTANNDVLHVNAEYPSRLAKLPVGTRFPIP